MTNIDDILARLSKKTSDKYRLAKDISKDYIPTASIGLNMVLGGGVGVGKQSTFYGNQSAGKSSILLQTIGAAQLAGRGCAYIDAEKTFDPVWAERLGVNTNELLVSQVSSIGDYADVSIDMIKAGVELIVVDSTSALMPKSFFDDGQVKAFENTGQIGQFAKELGQAGRMIQGENYTAAMVHISQVRMDLSGFHASQKASGGKEVEHADSLKVRLFSSKSDKEAIEGDITVGDQIMKEHIGRKVTWHIDKNKLNGHYGNGEYNLFFRGDHVGIDKYGELLSYGIKYGIVKQGGSWITIFDERVQGKDSASKYLRDNPTVADKIEGEILAQPI